MTRRTLIGIGSLLVASLGVTFFFLMPGGTPSMGAARRPMQTAWYQTTRQAPAKTSPARGTALSIDGQGSSGSTPGQIPASAEVLPDFDAARRDATSAAETEDRVRALQLLAEAPADVSLDVLVDASTNGMDARERAMAITSLRHLLTRGNGNGDLRVRNALLAASSDQDPVVVMLSQSLLKDLDSSR